MSQLRDVARLWFLGDIALAVNGEKA